MQLYGCTGSIFNINIAQHYDQKQVSDGFWKHFIIVVYKPPKKQKSAGTVLKTEEDAERPSFPADKSIAQSDMKRKRFMGRCFRKKRRFPPGNTQFSGQSGVFLLKLESVRQLLPDPDADAGADD